MRLCAFIDRRIPCVCYATSGSDFCTAHRDEGVLYRAAKPRGVKQTVKVCFHCRQPINPGQIARITPEGVVHAEGCEPHAADE